MSLTNGFFKNGGIRLACLVFGAGLMALPASAQAYRDCRSEQRSNQVAGTVIGGIIGGVLGSNIAARGHRGDGTALGAVVGGLAGSAAGAGTRDCPVYGPAPRSASTYGGPYDRTGAPGRYGPGGYDRYGDDVGRSPVYSGQDRDYRYDRDYSPGGGAYDYDRDNMRQNGRYQDRSRGATSEYDYYDSNNDQTSECRRVDQTTRLPDGTEVTRPTEACRTTRHGEWTIRD